MYRGVRYILQIQCREMTIRNAVAALELQRQLLSSAHLSYLETTLCELIAYGARQANNHPAGLYCHFNTAGTHLPLHPRCRNSQTKGNNKTGGKQTMGLKRYAPPHQTRRKGKGSILFLKPELQSSANTMFLTSHINTHGTKQKGLIKFPDVQDITHEKSNAIESISIQILC